MARRYVTPNADSLDALRDPGFDPELSRLRAWAAQDASRRDAGQPARQQARAGQQARVRVLRNERTYRPDSDPLGRQFAADVLRRFLWRDPEAERRLLQHTAEEAAERPALMQRAGAGTGNFAGLVVPQYLTDLYGPSAQALRPFADACEPHPLPAEGLTVNVPAVTTAASAAVQASENAAVASSSATATTLVTENVVTVSGSVTVSRQALERGVMAGELVMADLARSYATALDTAMLTTAVSGVGALAVLTTFTSGTPSPATCYSKVLQATAGVRKALLGVARPDLAVMTGSRWDWLSDPGTSWPLVMRGGAGDYALPNGLRVVPDDNIPATFGAGANQDRIYVAASRDCLLFEPPSSPLFIRVDQAAAAALSVPLVAFGYAAWCFRRHAGAIGAVDGTGLTPPSF